VGTPTWRATSASGIPKFFANYGIMVLMNQMGLKTGPLIMSSVRNPKIGLADAILAATANSS
jgi:hypothetical protein